MAKYFDRLDKISSLVDGGYGPWGEYDSCSALCGGGEKTRRRHCDDPKPAFGGNDCSALGPDTESAQCNTHECPGERCFQ